MCGIVGVFGRGDRAVVQSMLDCLVHRGPDDEHLVSGEDFAIGARRLSIVDVEAGRQPVTNEDRTIFAAQNGELYNYPRLRPQLLAAGHTLETHCDTEVLPHLYELHGDDAPLHVDGMFAFCVWDTKKRRGIIARDRMGKKPLYYTERNGALYFASEIKSLLRIPGFERKICAEALHYYLSYKHVPHPLTMFEGVRMLPPAHMLTWENGQLATKRYWKLDYTPRNVVMDENEIVDELIRILKKGIERRLMSDVPIGFFLSGGIDSSLSTALAAEICGDRIKTFTLTYANDSTNEGKELDRKWARWAAEHFRTDHHEEVVEFGHFPESIRKIIASFDEPFSGTVSTYFLAKLMSTHVKVALSGDGADELFGSYLSHRLAFPLANFPEYERTGDASLVPGFANQTEFLKRLYEPEDWRWRAKLLVLSDEEKRSFYSDDFAARVAGVSTVEQVRRDFSGLTAADPLNRVLEAEYNTIFADQVLAFVDRLSMAHSLEVRSAFLDTEFVEFVAGLPGNLKIRNGETKYILKKAALRYFPEEMVFRKKEGFVMPVTQWLFSDLEGYVRDTLSEERLARHGLFRADKVREMIDRLYAATEHDYREVNKVLSLLIFQEWYDLYMQ